MNKLNAFGRRLGEAGRDLLDRAENQAHAIEERLQGIGDSIAEVSEKTLRRVRGELSHHNTPPLNSLREDDELYPPLPRDPVEEQEDSFRDGKIAEAREDRRRKTLFVALAMPFLFIAGLVGMSYYSFALMIHVKPGDNFAQAKAHVLNFFSHFFSFAVFFGTMGSLLTAIIVYAPTAVDNGTIATYSNVALAVFFGIMFIGAVFGVYRAHADRQFKTIDFPSVRVRFNVDNLLAISSLVAEAVSLIAFVFQPQIPWTAESQMVPVLRRFILDLGVDMFTLSFWAMATVVAVFFIMVVSIVALHAIVGISLELLGSSWVVNIGFPLLGETFFIPLVTVLMSALDCRENPNYVEGSGANDRMLLDTTISVADDGTETIDGALTCWVGIHRVYAGLSLIALMSYFPTALFYFTRLNALSDGAFVGDKLDIKFLPVFYMWATLIRCVLAGISTFLSTQKTVMVLLNLAGTLTLLCLNLYYKPCCIKVINKLRTLSYSAAMWSSISALFTITVNDPSAWSSFIFWTSGMFIIVVAMIVTVIMNKSSFAEIEVYAFGEGRGGELGLGAERNIKIPLRSAHLSELTVDTIVAKGSMNFAIGVDRKVFAWGSGGLLTVDPPAGETAILEPTLSKALASKRLISIAVGLDVAFAISESGQVFCWSSRSNEDAARDRALELVSESKPERERRLSAASDAGLGIGNDNNDKIDTARDKALELVGPVGGGGSSGNKSKNRRSSVASSSGVPSALPSLISHGGDVIFKIPDMDPLDAQELVESFGLEGPSVLRGALSAISTRSEPSAVIGDIGGEIVTMVKISPVNSVFFLTRSGRLFAMGNNRNGILAVGAGAEAVAEPMVVGALSSVRIIDLCVSRTRVFAISDEGELFTWGSGAHGVLGHGDSEDSAVPTIVAAFADDDIRIAQAMCNDYYAMAISTTGKLFMWGLFAPITPHIGDDEDNTYGGVPEPGEIAIEDNLNDALQKGNDSNGGNRGDAEVTPKWMKGVGNGDDYSSRRSTSGNKHAHSMHRKKKRPKKNKNGKRGRGGGRKADWRGKGTLDPNTADEPYPIPAAAFDGIAIVRILAEAEVFPVVICERGIAYRVVYKTVVEAVANPNATDYLAEGERRRKASVEYASLRFGTTPHIVARRLLGGTPVMAIDANSKLVVAATQGKGEDSRNSLIHILYYRKPKTDWSSIAEYDEPIKEGKSYPLTGLSVVKSIHAGRSHVNVLAHK